MPRLHTSSPAARWITPFAAALLTVVVACAPAAPPSPTTPPAKPAAQPTTAPAKPTTAPPKPAATPVPAKPAATTAPAKPAASPAAKAEAKPAASPAAKTVALPKPEVTSVKVAFAALEPNAFPSEYAVQQGLYKKYGLDNVEVLFFEGASRTLQTITGGQVDAAATGAGAPFSAGKAGVPLQLVGMYINKFTDDLVAGPNIKTAADLKGKTVAVSTFGGDSHAAVLAALQVLGLTDKDVTVQQVGGQSARIAALKAGSIAAAPIDGTLRNEMKSQGFNILVSLLESPATIAKTGLMFREDWRLKNPNAALAMVAATLESMNMIFADPEKAAAGLARWQQAKDPAQAVGIMKQWVTFAQRDMRWTKEGFEALKTVQLIAEPEIKDIPSEKVYAMEYLDKLRDMGFNQAIGLPSR